MGAGGLGVEAKWLSNSHDGNRRTRSDMPVSAIFHVHPIEPAAAHPAIGAAAEALGIPSAIGEERAEKLASLQQMAIEFVLSGGA